MWWSSVPAWRSGHLPAGHAVNGVVDEDDRDVFSPVGCVKTLRDANSGEVSVSLVGKDDTVREDPFDPGSRGRTAAVLCFDHVDVEIVIGQNGAACRRYADRDTADIHLIDHFAMSRWVMLWPHPAQ